MKYTAAEDDILRTTCTGDLPYSIDDLATRLGRGRNSVALRISRLGLGNYARRKTDEARARCSAVKKGKMPAHNIGEYSRGKPGTFKGKRHSRASKKQMSLSQKTHIATYGHSRAMLGKHHSDKTKSTLSAALAGRTIPTEQRIRTVKTRLAKYGPQWAVRSVSWKQGWREVGGQRIFARSRWEANYARYLAFLLSHSHIAAWQHEGETFWFEKIRRGTVSYMPDFKITNPDGSVEYHEVKGWMDARSKTKLKRMAKYHPHIKIRLIDKHWFRENSRKLSGLLPGWEHCRS